MEPSPGPERQPDRWTIGDFGIVIAAWFTGAVLSVPIVVVTSDIGVIIATTLLVQHAGFALGLVVVARRRGASAAQLGLVVEPRDGIYLFLGVGLQFAVVFLFAPITQLLDGEGPAQGLTEAIGQIDDPWIQVTLAVSLVLVAPVLEETIFRGLFYRIVEQRWSSAAAVGGSALVFALFHMFDVGAQDPVRAAVVLMPQLFLVGLVLGRLRRRAGRLGPAIFTHAGFNLVAAVVLLLVPDALG